MSIKALLKDFLSSEEFRRVCRIARLRASVETEVKNRVASFLRGDATLDEFCRGIVEAAGAHGPIGGEKTALFPFEATALARFVKALERAAPGPQLEAELRRALAGIDLRDPTERLRTFVAFVAGAAEKASPGEEGALSPTQAAAFITFCWSALYDLEIPVFHGASDRGLEALARAGLLERSDYGALDPAERFRVFLRFARALRGLLARVNPQLGFWAVEGFLDWFGARAGSKGHDGAAPAGRETDEERRAHPELFAAAGPPDPGAALARETFFSEALVRDLLLILELRGQLLLEGPTAVGKTFLARRLAQAFAGDPRRVVFLHLHPGWRYQDLVESAPPPEGTAAAAPGVLATLAFRAAAEPASRFAIVLDDAGRVDLRALLGECVAALDDRAAEIILPYSRRAFRLPPNLVLIATAALPLSDAALRRRFPAARLEPDPDLLARFLAERTPGLAWLAEAFAALNRRLAEDAGPEAVLGHGIFLRHGLDEIEVERIWRYEVRPYVEARIRDRNSLARCDLAALRPAPVSRPELLAAEEAPRRDPAEPAATAAS
jgi:5-methylcytosine-specific restriction protein B